jgi:iron complex outermembrane receptor protein
MKKLLNSSLLVGAFLFPLLISAQDKPIINATVSGVILDAKTNERIIGATVSIKGTTNGASTDVNGEFALITGQKLPFTLIVSFIGYIKKEVVINDSKVEIRIEQDTKNLADVVVTSRRRQEAVQDM